MRLIFKDQKVYPAYEIICNGIKPTKRVSILWLVECICTTTFTWCHWFINKDALANNYNTPQIWSLGTSNPVIPLFFWHKHLKSGEGLGQNPTITQKWSQSQKETYPGEREVMWRKKGNTTFWNIYGRQNITYIKPKAHVYQFSNDLFKKDEVESNSKIPGDLECCIRYSSATNLLLYLYRS